jgi:hypothetical protein
MRVGGPSGQRLMISIASAGFTVIVRACRVTRIHNQSPPGPPTCAVAGLGLKEVSCSRRGAIDPIRWTDLIWSGRLGPGLAREPGWAGR